MKSPLRKRLLRELKSEFGKYLVVFIMMAITIAFVSGFLVADGSMIRAYDDSFQKYNIENGYFRTKKKLTTTQKEDIEKSDVKIYENFYIEQKLTNGSTVRPQVESNHHATPSSLRSFNDLPRLSKPCLL